MRPVDWAVVLIYFGVDRRRRHAPVKDGPTKSKATSSPTAALPWWAVGLSVMATQISAITLVGTTGRGYADRHCAFVQLYFGLPLAMVILSLDRRAVLLPAPGVFTAYEYLERRFDVRTTDRPPACCSSIWPRTLSRRDAGGAAPSCCRSILGWSIPVTVLALAVPMVLYTSLGGVQAVAWTDVKQMVIIVTSLFTVSVGVLLLQHHA